MFGSGPSLGSLVIQGLAPIPTKGILRFTLMAGTGSLKAVVGQLVLGHCVALGAIGTIPMSDKFLLVSAVPGLTSLDGVGSPPHQSIPSPLTVLGDCVCTLGQTVGFRLTAFIGYKGLL